jgi:mannose-6-phosphate isomerase
LLKTVYTPLTQEEINSLTTRPIRFEEGNFADYMWGGNELYRLKGMKSNGSQPIAAESWEVSGHPKYPSKVKLPGGATRTLIELLDDTALAEQILGKEVVRQFSSNFPALVKFFDVQKHMSVQVHPPDTIARQLGETDPGKGEVFVVMDVYEGGEGAVYLGLKEDVDSKRFTEAMHQGENILELLHKIRVKPGEVYVLPSGVIHCWTGGSMAVEITEPSDLTYRLYDFGRGRPMHLEKGLASINFDIQHGPSLENATRSYWSASQIKGLDEVYTKSRLRIERIHLNQYVQATKIPTHDTFDVLMGIEGSLELSSDKGNWAINLKKGFSTLIPAGAGDYTVRNLVGKDSSQALRITVKLKE